MFVLLWGFAGSFEDEICTFRYGPHLNWNYKACNTTRGFEFEFLNGFELFVEWNFSKVASLAAKVCPTNLHQ